VLIVAIKGPGVLQRLGSAPSAGDRPSAAKQAARGDHLQDVVTAHARKTGQGAFQMVACKKQSAAVGLLGARFEIIDPPEPVHLRRTVDLAGTSQRVAARTLLDEISDA
jgi:hypothetical protein